LFIGASPSGKAAVFGTAIRWFESSRPSHLFSQLNQLVRRFLVLARLNNFKLFSDKSLNMFSFPFRKRWQPRMAPAAPEMEIMVQDLLQNLRE
jgi:hypothetical protein